MIDLALLGAGAGLGAAAAWGGSRALLHRALLRRLRAPRLPHDVLPPVGGGPRGDLQSLHLPAANGRHLAAWLVRPRHAAAHHPAVIAMHGWGANASTLWPAVEPMAAAGIAVLLLDARCHGDSDDEAFTSMPRFAADIAAGWQWLVQQPQIDPGRIALLGHSVGAAAALLLAANPGAADPPAAAQPVRAVVSLAAFADPREMMRRFLAEYRVPYPLVGQAVLGHVQRVIGARFADIAPLRSVRGLRCPLLLVHGRGDTTVPFGDALRLQHAAPQAELLAVDGEHDLRSALAPHAPRIVAFLEHSLRT